MKLRRRLILAIAVPAVAAVGRLVAGRLRANGRTTGAQRIERVTGLAQRLRRPRRGARQQERS